MSSSRRTDSLPKVQGGALWYEEVQHDVQAGIGPQGKRPTSGRRPARNLRGFPYLYKTQRSSSRRGSHSLERASGTRSPEQGVLRVREIYQAEVEVCFNPETSRFRSSTWPLTSSCRFRGATSSPSRRRSRRDRGGTYRPTDRILPLPRPELLRARGRDPKADISSGRWAT